MEESTATAIMTGAIAFVGGGGAAVLINGWLARDKQVAEQRRADAEQPIEQYSGLVQTLLSRVSVLEQHVKECVEQHLKAVENAGRLEGMLSEQRRTLEHMRETSVRDNRDSIQAAAVVAAEGVKTAAVVAAEGVRTAVALQTTNPPGA